MEAEKQEQRSMSQHMQMTKEREMQDVRARVLGIS